MILHRPARLLCRGILLLLPALAVLFWVNGGAQASPLPQGEAQESTNPGLPSSPVTDTLGFMYFPLILKQPPPYFPVEQALFCDSLAAPLSILDNNLDGVYDVLFINDFRVIADLDVALKVNHTWVSDLTVSLTHLDSGRSITLLDRPGIPASDLGCREDNIRAIFDDEISYSVENKCASYPAAISGIYIPQDYLDAFDGDQIFGQWQLNIADLNQLDDGDLVSWCLYASVSPAPETPTPTPPPGEIPGQSILNGISGKDQKYNLDCESRSAVDWAGYFGVSIGEDQFFNGLPEADNPDAGFVGNVNGLWGQIPPEDYGVHAEPIAARLRDLGLDAYARRPLKWDALRAEIAAGRPVIVWIIGASAGGLQNGSPVIYTPSDGQHTLVAAYEHTVVVTGYTDSLVYYLNGDQVYTISVEKFLDSWSALGNMAVTASAP